MSAANHIASLGAASRQIKSQRPVGGELMS